MRRLVVGDAVGRLDVRARLGKQRGEHQPVRLVDLAVAERLARPAELRAGRDDRNAGAPRDERRGDTGGRERGETRRGERRSPPRAPWRPRPRRRPEGERSRRWRPPCGTTTVSPSSVTCSIGTTASAPSGTTPPVAIPIASPGASGRDDGRPAAIRATTGSVPGVSAARSANPSIAELGKRGRSTTALASSASTRPAASPIGTGSAASRRDALEHAASASSTVSSSATTMTLHTGYARARDLGRRPRPRRGAHRRPLLRAAGRRARGAGRAVGGGLRRRRLA